MLGLNLICVSKRGPRWQAITWTESHIYFSQVFSQFKEIRDSVSVHMVEVSPTLSGMQAEKLSGSRLESELDANSSGNW